MAVSPDLLAILRCPYCVSGSTRKPGNDPGQLKLVDDSWLVCQEEDCERKYPIKEDIPVMLIEEGDKWVETTIDELPEPGQLVEPAQFSPVAESGSSDPAGPSFLQNKPLLGLTFGVLGLIVTAAYLFWLYSNSQQRA